MKRAPATWRVDARRAKKSPPRRIDETAHGDGLYHAAEPERKAGTRDLSNARLARRRPSAYLCRRAGSKGRGARVVQSTACAAAAFVLFLTAL